MKNISISVKGETINLKTSENVFTPSPHGTDALAQYVDINEGEKVIDIGSGTGFLGILAAKQGGVVSASDILDEAVELTKENFKLNNVEVDARKGDLFSPFEGEKFDVIIANVPQELFSPSLLNKYKENKITSYHGGEQGNEILMEVLKKAPGFMHKNSKLYVVVFTITNYRESLSYISENYSSKLLNFYSGPVKHFVYEDLDWYLKNQNLNVYKKEDKYWADLFTFELRLK